MNQQDLFTSIENAAQALCVAGKRDEVEFVLREKGNGARSIEDLASTDYDAVFDDLFQREVDLKD